LRERERKKKREEEEEEEEEEEDKALDITACIHIARAPSES
jgi:hypothetical protein